MQHETLQSMNFITQWCCSATCTIPADVRWCVVLILPLSLGTFVTRPQLKWQKMWISHPGALWPCSVTVHLPFLVVLVKPLCVCLWWGWGCCFYAQWIIVQGGMCPFQGKLAMPVVQPPAEPPPSLSLSPPLSEPDAVAHVGLMVQKHPAKICVGMWWRARA